MLNHWPMLSENKILHTRIVVSWFKVNISNSTSGAQKD